MANVSTIKDLSLFSDGVNPYKLQPSDWTALRSLLSSLVSVAEVNSSAEADAAFAAGHMFVVRLDLLGVLTPGETVPPVVNSFIIPSTSNSLVIAITEFYTSDAVGVTGWFITESAVAPNASLSNLGSLTTSRTAWATSVITSYTAVSAGLRTLYAWAKDAAGNVSVAVTDTVTITLADVTDPTISQFDIPATSNSLTVAITTWTAADNVGVTGYFLKEGDSTQPLVTDSPWFTTKPAQFTFSSIGAKTLYGWVRDAAGRRSAAASDTCTIASLDVTKPWVTDFQAAATGTSIAHAISAFASGDDVGVTGWFVTESSTAPTINLSNLGSLVTSRTTWATSAITSYNITTVGSRTLYPWVSDGVNVSLEYGAPVAVVITTEPNAVTSLVASSGAYGQSVITFTGSVTDPSHSPVASYNLRWKLSIDPSYTTIENITSPYTKTGLANGATYNFIVDAVNTIGTTPYGNAVNATTLAIPSAPTITSVTPSSTANSIDLGTVSGAVSYNLYWTTDGGLTAAQIVSDGTKITSPNDPYNHSSISNGTTYRYVQTAVNAVGEGAPSAIVSGTPVAADTTPDQFTFTDQTNVAISTLIESLPIVVAGINTAATISISAGGAYAISTNAGSSYGAWTSSSGTVSVNNWVKVRHTSSASNSATADTVLNIGGVTDTFTTTTEAAAVGGFLADFETTTGNNAGWTLYGFVRSNTGALSGSYSLIYDAYAQEQVLLEASKTITINNGETLSFKFTRSAAPALDPDGAAGVGLALTVGAYERTLTQNGNTYSWTSNISNGDYSVSITSSCTPGSEEGGAYYYGTSFLVKLDDIMVQ